MPKTTNVHSGFHGDSGVQNHSAGDHYPALIVCIGGFPKHWNDSAHAEVWIDGHKIGPFRTHGHAERVACALAEWRKVWGFISAATAKAWNDTIYKEQI